MKKFLFVLILMLFSFAVSAEEAQKNERFYFFYSETCPHCHEAMPFLEEIEKEFPNIEFRKLEVSQDAANLAIFSKKVEKCDNKGGVPTFIFLDQCIVGFKKGTSEEKIRAMIAGAGSGSAREEGTQAAADKEKSAKKESQTVQGGKNKGKKKNWRIKTKKDKKRKK